MSDPTNCLGPDLRPEGPEVALRVVQVVVLVHVEPALVLGGQGPGDVHVAVRVIVGQTGRRDDDLGPVRLDGGDLLVGALGRGGDDGLVAPHGGQHGHGRPGVAGAGRHHRPSWSQQTRLLRLVEDVLHDPVLHGESRIEELAFSENFDTGNFGTGQRGDVHERCRA